MRFNVFTRLAHSAALCFLCACKNDQSSSTFEHNKILVTSGRTTSVTVAGNTYENPAVKTFPHVLRIHHASKKYLYIDEEPNRMRIVYHDGATRQGISREIIITQGNANWVTATKLLLKIKSLQEPVVEEISCRYGSYGEPLWQNLVITEAHTHKPVPSLINRVFIIIDFAKSTVQVLDSPPDAPKKKELMSARGSEGIYYRKYASETVEMDVFEASGMHSYDITRDITRRIETRFTSTHTKDYFQFLGTQSTLTASGNPVKYDAISLIGKMEFKRPASLFGDRIVLLHGADNSYVIYVESGAAPTDMSFTMMNTHTGKVMQISGGNNPDQQTLNCLFQLSVELCQMHSPVVTMVEAGEINEEFQITWEGYSVDQYGGRNVREIQKYLLRLDFTRGLLRLEKY